MRRIARLRWILAGLLLLVFPGDALLSALSVFSYRALVVVLRTVYSGWKAPYATLFEIVLALLHLRICEHQRHADFKQGRVRGFAAAVDGKIGRAHVCTP